MGGVLNRVEGAPASAAPLVRVVGYGMMGGIQVRHRKDDPESERGTNSSTPRPSRPEPARPRVSTDGPAPTPEATVGLDGHTVTLLFTDIVDSTGLAERLGDQRWYGVLRAHNAIVREQIARHDGQEIKAQGDGFMVAFRSARRALLAAIDIQRALQGYRRGHPDMPVHARVGLHTGEVVADDGDLYGRNVILAARITAAAESDEVLASSLTKQLAEAGGDLGFGPQRQISLKGLSDAWGVHTVEWA
jgi:eukaryotic-like serine/threonine-protein kinase